MRQHNKPLKLELFCVNFLPGSVCR